jgi:hypothetical protein
MDMLNVSNHYGQQKLFIILPCRFFPGLLIEIVKQTARREVKGTAMYEIYSHSVSTKCKSFMVKVKKKKVKWGVAVWLHHS